MKDFQITAARDLDSAARRLHDLERHAERRDQLIDTLDLDALGPKQLYEIFQDAIEDAIDWGHLYLDHLASMKALGMQLAAPTRLAA